MPEVQPLTTEEITILKNHVQQLGLVGQFASGEDARKSDPPLFVHNVTTGAVYANSQRTAKSLGRLLEWLPRIVATINDLEKQLDREREDFDRLADNAQGMNSEF